ncbi:MAG: uncharacterized protein QOD90_5042 [Mycobacterium sp.]|nr:uncharacterized protein [Mycobacterium sp.]
MPKPKKPSNTLTRLFVLAGAALAVVGVVGCDAAAAPAAVPGTAAPRQVTVIGEGKVEGTPDTLTVSLSIAATAPDAVSASNQTSSRANAVTDALVGQGIDRKDISTTTVTLQPQYGGSDNTTIVGYQSSNSIDVKLRKIETGPQVLGVITTTGGDATRINSVTYSIEDDSQLIKDARSRAFDDAKSRAQQYAELSGLDLGKVLSISETGGATPPPPSPVRYDVAAEAAPLSPGQQTVGFSVTVVWELG